MASTKEKPKAEKILPWVQIIALFFQIFAIIAAGLWAYWFTFVYKMKTVPELVPVNVLIDLKLTKTGVSLRDKKLVKKLAAIELSVAASNPSSHTTHLLPSIFIVYGYKIADSNPALSEIPVLTADSTYLMKHCVLSPPTVIAWGNLFENKELKKNDELKPSEVVGRTFVFYVPVDKYDVIEAHAQIPNGKDLSGIDETLWSPDTEYGLLLTLFRKGADGTLEPISRDSSGGYFVDPGKLQTAHSMKMMSLW